MLSSDPLQPLVAVAARVIALRFSRASKLGVLDLGEAVPPPLDGRAGAAPPMRSVAAQLAQALRYRGQSMVVLEREPPSFHAVGIGFALERNRRVHNVGVLIAHVV